MQDLCPEIQNHEVLVSEFQNFRGLLKQWALPKCVAVITYDITNDNLLVAFLLSQKLRLGEEWGKGERKTHREVNGTSESGGP